MRVSQLHSTICWWDFIAACNYFCSFVNDRTTTRSISGFSVLSGFYWFICLFSPPISYCLDYCSFVVSPGVWSDFILQNCIDYPGSFALQYFLTMISKHNYCLFSSLFLYPLPWPSSYYKHSHQYTKHMLCFKKKNGEQDISPYMNDMWVFFYIQCKIFQISKNF